MQEKDYRFVLTTEEQQKRILKAVKPSRAYFESYQNLHLAYGVEHIPQEFFVTQIYYMSDAIKRCGEPDDYRYLFLTKHGDFTVCCQSRGENVEQVSVPAMCPLSKEVIREAVEYQTKSEHEIAFWHEYKETHNGEAVYKFNRALVEKLLPEEKKKEPQEQPATQPTEQKKKLKLHPTAWAMPIGLFLGVLYFLCRNLAGEIPDSMAYPWMAMSVVLMMIGTVHCSKCTAQHKSPFRLYEWVSKEEK